MSDPSIPERRSGLTRIGALLLIFVCITLAILLAFTRTQLHELRQDLSKRLSDTDQLSHQVQQTAQQANETSRETSTRLALLESRFAQSQNQQIELEALYQDLMRNHDDWILAEVEQLVIIANQQLELTGNVQSALAALEAADMRLQRIDKPLFSQLRETLKQDMDHLRALPYVDTNGIALRLDALSRQVDNLTLATDSRPRARATPASPAVGPWASLTQKVLKDLGDAIKIRRMDNPELPLLTPEQSFFLRENLKLRLLSARNDALTHQELRYQDDLKTASDWLTRYFDTQTPAFNLVKNGLDQLLTTPVTIPIPDVSATLSAVHAARGMHP